jgi:hypothetical protein
MQRYGKKMTKDDIGELFFILAPFRGSGYNIWLWLALQNNKV